MGHSSKKKKRNKGGRGRAPSKDHSHSGDDQDLLSEEITALAAIFQEDLKVVSKTPYTQLAINLRPYSNDMGFEDLNVSALLLVRCLPGYPHKCPKLQIVPEKGLSKKDADRLISLLLDQANIYAREGRVMIFNLVEAAQEFLSEIVPVEQPLKSGTCLGANRKDESARKGAAVQLDVCYHSEEPFVYSCVDLYGDLCGDNATWGSHDSKVADQNSSKIFRAQTGLIGKSKDKNILLQSHTLANLESVIPDHSIFQNMTPEALHATKHGAIPWVVTKLNFVAEETETDSKFSSPKAYDQQSVLDSSEKGSDSAQHEVADLVDQTRKVDVCNSEGESSTSSSFVSTEDDTPQSKKKDLLLVHLLHLVCFSKGSLATALPEISSELYNLGVLSEWARDLVAVPPSVFAKAFDRAFEQHMTSSRFSEFWKPGISYSGDNASSRPNSRYLNDFEEVCSLGRGGFGHVVLCKNKLDGRQYAVKRIRLKDKSPYVNEKILREVATLSRLQHQHVVRYYQAWVETEYGNYDGETAWGSRAAEGSTSSYMDVNPTNVTGDNRLELTYLYIQMEYCPRTLRQDFESYSSSFDKDYTWHLFRQIVEGLAHIHSQGIIHRDLTPSNIFFDVRNDIKIGDFGLAKFLKLEQLDHDQYFPTETTGVSVDGTSQVGTYFYTAPEIDQRWPQINEKVDMYSLGVIFFELWHPFATAMERHIVLSELKQKGLLPPSWVAKFPRESTLLQRLMSPSPSDRPSATELLQRELPPRMEDEWLNDILRTIQTREDTYVYDRVVSTIFDEDRLIMKSHSQHADNAKMTKNEPSYIQYTELDLEMRNIVAEACKEVFKQHCAKRMEISPMRVFDGCYPLNRKPVRLLTQGGNMLELCHELRSPFVNWIITNQKLSFKRYEISWVYRRAIGHSAPSRFLQGDFDIIGGASPLTEAEVIKVAMDVATCFFHPNAIDIRLNHGRVLESIWSWVGIASELRQNVAELLSLITSSCPQSTNRKSNWVFVRRQLLQDLNLSEAIVDRLQTADLRFCGSADQALARLRGALSSDRFTSKALEELSVLLRCLRAWSIAQQVSIDVLMPPTEVYHRELFFQMYLKESNPGSVAETILLAVGGRYDHLINQMWDHEYKSSPPGAVGVSLALEKILNHSSIDIRPFRAESSTSVLVCSRGGGGLLQERMAFVAELWQANIKAEFVPQPDPSVKEQYEYASEHDIKCLVIITEAGLSQTGLVKVRQLDLKREKEVTRADIVKFLTEATTRPRDLTTWA
ncbi:eIF-2-alpha kinase GCN2 isoform X3 [Elaeis guineensis]|uniref:non-specific serine/threonine protein kinase n=1 Tax=Elaeis guineensis var. tenera TaxID=51953 RepID=A0A8N4IE50_ELAGV|nr:eIF-2-alpha kinase GCN2 isoform X2 [Elaeis guineensis]